MKRFTPLLSTFIVLLLSTASYAGAGKTDLPLKMLDREAKAGKHMVVGKAMSIKEGLISVIIKADNTAKVAEKIKKLGGKVGSINGPIMTARIPKPPSTAIKELEAMSEVKKIEASMPMRKLNDSSRYQTGVATLQSGSSGIQYNGDNVVVGVVDTGLDFSRDDFLGSDGNTRVQYMRLQTIGDDDDFEIYHCAKDKIVDGSCIIPSNNDSGMGHGTHVTGIAAGNHPLYTGVAREADIMFVRNLYDNDVLEDADSSEDSLGMTYTAGVLDGINEIFKKADIIDKPAVINLSQGTHIGAHDGTSLLEQGIDAAVAGQYAENGKNYGRIVVAAAGNEHTVMENVAGIEEGMKKFVGGAHASVSVPDGKSYGYRIWVLSESAPIRNPMLVDIWLRSGQADKCKVAGFAYKFVDAMVNGAKTSSAIASTGDILLTAEDENIVTSYEKQVVLVLGVDAADLQNGKPRALFGFTHGDDYSWTTIATNTQNTGYVMDIVVRASGGSCNGDMWIEGGGSILGFMRDLTYSVETTDSGAGYTFKSGMGGDSLSTVCLPATGNSVIAVGAYLSEKPYGSGKSEWVSIDGKTRDATDNAGSELADGVNGGTVGELCPFSSVGPTADGRMKPELIAPGDPIISTLPTGFTPSNNLMVDATHYKLQGTSQASPHVAGIVALMLQKNNKLTQADVTAALTSTASLASAPKADVGYGKVNAVKAMDAIAADTSGYAGTGDLKTTDIEEDETSTSTSASTKKGCGLIPTGAPSFAGAFFLAISLVGMSMARRKKR